MNSDTEPSLLDYLKAKYNPFTKGIIEIPESEEGNFILPNKQDVTENESAPLQIPNRTIFAIFSAIIAQLSLEPSPGRTYFSALVFYSISIALLIVAYKKGEWNFAETHLSKFSFSENTIDEFSIQKIKRFPFALLLGLITFLLFNPLAFNFFNTLLWLSTIIITISVFWDGEINLGSLFRTLKSKVNLSSWKISPSHLLFFVVLSLGIWMRFTQINSMPVEMTSSHAEIMHNVVEVLNGEQSVFFPQNTGREPLPIYIVAKVISQMGFENSFLSMKIAAALISGLTLIFVYLIGSEIGNQRTGLFSMGLMGLGYWPIVLARAAQGFETATLFWSIVFYLILRAFKTNTWNNYLLCGLFVGIGLYSYAAFRIVPLVIFLIFFFAIVFVKDNHTKWHLLYGFLITTIVAMVVALPIIRYALEKPEIYGYWMLTRLTGLERSIEGSSFLIFLQNLWGALTITSWNGGGTWTFSIPNRPSLDIISGMFYHLGIVFLFFQIFIKKSKSAILLLATIPLLLLPSALSLAFPIENPSLSRASMAMVPIFVIAGITLEFVWTIFENQKNKIAKNISLVFLAGLLGLSFIQNYSLVFNKYANNYQASSRNTYEIGQVVKSFANLAGTTETNFAIVYPHWADTRLIMINAGFPGQDNALPLDQIDTTLDDPRLKLFLLHPDHTEGIEKLSLLYPNGFWETYHSNVEKDFILFYAPSN
jgi:hypothetical protein